MTDRLSLDAFRAAMSAFEMSDSPALAPLRYFALPNELAAFGGAELLGREIGATEVWSRPPIGQAPELLWSLTRPTAADS